ncbi:MAG: ANTAR domain-containing response regulator [Magnetovibrionaceae bacterium]
MSDPIVQIAVIDENPVRAAILEDGLRQAGYAHVTRIDDMNNLLRKLYALDPDMIVIDLENPSRDMLEQLFQVSKLVKRPVAMFVDQSEAGMIQKAVEAGVSAYVVDGLKKERIHAVVETAISRFRAFSALENELDAARSELQERKVIDRAKALLMRERGLTEEDAYQALRRSAMNQKKRMAEVADSVITTFELMGGGNTTKGAGNGD